MEPEPSEQLKATWAAQANREIDELLKTENFVKAHQIMMAAFGYQDTSAFMIAMREVWVSVFVSGARYEHERESSRWDR